VDKAQRPSGSLNRVALAAGEEQDRRAAPDRNAGVTAPLLPRLRDMLFWSLQRVFAVVILRSQDGVPEYTERTETPAITNPWGWFPFLALGDACSLLIIAHAFTISRKGESGFEGLLLAGLLTVNRTGTVWLFIGADGCLLKLGKMLMMSVVCAITLDLHHIEDHRVMDDTIYCRHYVGWSWENQTLPHWTHSLLAINIRSSLRVRSHSPPDQHRRSCKPGDAGDAALDRGG